MKLKRILAVGTAMLGVSAFVPTPIVQKCVSMVFADDDSLSYGDFTYRISSSSVYNSETGKYESHEYARVFKLADSAKGDIVIPDEIEGYKVEVVDFEGLFYGRDDITSVTFPKYIVSAESFYAIPETCEIKFAEGCENFCIENGFLVQNNASYTDYNDGWRTKQGKSILRSIEPLSGEVTVPEGIVQLYGTFSGNADITTINLPSTVSYIGWYFCADMPSLTAINVAEDNPTYFSYKGALGRYRDVGSGYYDEENSEWVHVPELAKYILAVPEGYEGEFVVDDGDALTLSSICFEDVSKMTAVKLGKDTIFNCAGFAGCTSLEEIELNGEVYSVSGIEKWRQSYYDEETGEWRSSDEAESFNMTEAMFGDTKWYQEQPDGVLYCGDTVIGYKGEPSGDKLDIKDGTRTIVDKAFNGLDIAEANIPASVEYIGRYAFDCPNLTAVNIAADNKEYCSDEGVVYDKDKTMLKLYPQGKTSESYTVPDGVQIIVPNAFDGNKFIKTVDIPDSVYNISGWDEYGGSFKNCTALENIVIPSSVGYLDSGAFYGCKLKSLDLPATLDSFNAGHSNYDYLIFRNPQCEIQGMNPCTLVGLDGSSAQAFAQEHQLEFMLLDDYDKAQATATTTTTTTTTTTSTTTTATTTTTTKATTASTTAPPTTTTTTTTPTPPTTTTTTTTAQPTTTTTASTTAPVGGGSSTTASESTTAPVSTTEPATTTEHANPDEPDMSAFFGSWISYKAENKGQPSDIPEDEAAQLVIVSGNTGRMTYLDRSADLTWAAAENGKKMTLTVDGDTADIALVGGELVLYVAEGKAMYFKHGEKPVDFGDPNNDKKVDSKDASFVLVQYAKMSTGGEAALTEAEKAAADVNKDGKVDAKDASTILAYYSYLSTGGEGTLDEFLAAPKKTA